MLKPPNPYFATNAQFAQLRRDAREANKFRAKVIDIEVGQNEVVLNEEEAKAMNLQLLDRVKIKANKGGREVTAIVNYSHRYVQVGEVEILAELGQQLGIRTGDFVFLEPTQRPKSLDYIRKKLDKQLLSDKEITEIITDLMEEKLSSAELAAFITAVYMDELNSEETTSLTKAIYESGDRLEFPKGQTIVSEHSIGGIAGDRVSIILVPLLASLGLTVPKTCTRAISSAAGTADTLEVFCPVSLSISEIKKNFKRQGMPDCDRWCFFHDRRDC